MNDETIVKNRERLEDNPEWLEGDCANYGSVEHLSCPVCGAYCSSRTADFYKWNPERIRCYNCQDNNK